MRFALAVLAVWRVTHLLAKEDGPWDLIVRLRRALGDTFFGRLMDCSQCLSLWVAAPFTLFLTNNILQWFVGWLAISGAACLLELAVAGPDWMLPATEKDIEGGTHHELLWPETGGGQPPTSTVGVANDISSDTVHRRTAEQR